MTTDPRVIECAKAVALIEGVDWNTLDLLSRNVRIARAITCILKWLVQEPTDVMCDEGNEFDCRPLASEVYTAMCAQAAKEIVDG